MATCCVESVVTHCHFFFLMTTGSIKFYQRSAVVPTQEHIFSKTKSNQNQIVEFIINIIEKQDFAQYALFEA